MNHADLPEKQEGTVARVIERVIHDISRLAATTDLKPLGNSPRYTLRRIQRLDIGKKQAAALEESDILEFCKDLRLTRAASTVKEYVGYLNGALKYAKSSWKDCKNISLVCIEDARHQLKKQGLIGTSARRKRIATEEELERILAWLGEYATRKRVKLKVVPAILFGLAASRRRGEVCRITHGDIDWDHKDDEGNPAPMYTVRDLKHPTNKKGNDKTFPLLEPMPQIIRMQPRLTDSPDERVFPYNPHSLSVLYSRCLKELSIENLHLHDNRRAAITLWLKKFTPHQVARFVSGHETTVILERNYDATDPADGHALFRAIERANAL